MRRAINTKLNSRRGASLSFALVLFLVCAVVGTVVLTAATAAAGRLAGIADFDRRYYSVNSAAELLKEALNGKSVAVVKYRDRDVMVESTKYYILPNSVGNASDDPLFDEENSPEPIEKAKNSLGAYTVYSDGFDGWTYKFYISHFLNEDLVYEADGITPQEETDYTNNLLWMVADYLSTCPDSDSQTKEKDFFFTPPLSMAETDDFDGDGESDSFFMWVEDAGNNAVSGLKVKVSPSFRDGELVLKIENVTDSGQAADETYVVTLVLQITVTVQSDLGPEKTDKVDTKSDPVVVSITVNEEEISRIKEIVTEKYTEKQNVTYKLSFNVREMNGE